MDTDKVGQKEYRAELAYWNSVSHDILILHRVNISRNLVENSFSIHKHMEFMSDFRTYTQLMQSMTILSHQDSVREKMEKQFNAESLMLAYRLGRRELEVEYQSDFTQGGYRWVRVVYHLLSKPGPGDIMAFIYVYDIHDAKMLQHIFNKLVELQYDYLMYIDTRTGGFHKYGDKQIFPPMDEKNGDYETQKNKVIDTYVLSADRELCKNRMSIWYIRKQLEADLNYHMYLTLQGSASHLLRKKLTFSYLDQEETVIMLTRTDITDLFSAEEKKQKELEEALEAARSANKAKRNFLSHMSHEIRTPLNGINGMLDLLGGDLSREQEEYVKKAKISVRHLSGLINDILDMSRIESGKMVLQEEWVTLDELAENTDAVILPLANEKGIHYNKTEMKTVYRAIFIDPGRLQQILINLLSNAVKYSEPKAFVSYAITQNKLDQEMVETKITVKDTGLGMSEDLQKRIFQPFEQGDSIYTKNGTGLGLAITKQLIDMMKGSIEVKSRLGEGTSITVTLTTKGTDILDKEGETFSKYYNFEELDFSGKRALLVEDNEINMEIAIFQLKSLGLLVETATDGDEAVQMFSDSEEGYYDIIFMDVMMQRMDGLQATGIIRSLLRKDAKSVSIVAMTANAFEDDVHKSLESGMNYHLSKPFEKVQMQKILAAEFLKNA